MTDSPVAQAQTQSEFARLGGLNLLHAVLTNEVSHTQVQAACSAALGHLVDAHEDNQLKVAELGGVTAVLAGLARHPTIAEVQRDGCWAIRKLAFHPDNQVRA